MKNEDDDIYGIIIEQLSSRNLSQGADILWGGVEAFCGGFYANKVKENDLISQDEKGRILTAEMVGRMSGLELSIEVLDYLISLFHRNEFNISYFCEKIGFDSLVDSLIKNDFEKSKSDVVKKVLEMIFTKVIPSQSIVNDVDLSNKESKEEVEFEPERRFSNDFVPVPQDVDLEHNFFRVCNPNAFDLLFGLYPFMDLSERLLVLDRLFSSISNNTRNKRICSSHGLITKLCQLLHPPSGFLTESGLQSPSDPWEIGKIVSIIQELGSHSLSLRELDLLLRLIDNTNPYFSQSTTDGEENSHSTIRVFRDSRIRLLILKALRKMMQVSSPVNFYFDFHDPATSSMKKVADLPFPSRGYSWASWLRLEPDLNPRRALLLSCTSIETSAFIQIELNEELAFEVSVKFPTGKEQRTTLGDFCFEHELWYFVCFTHSRVLLGQDRFHLYINGTAVQSSFIKYPQFAPQTKSPSTQSSHLFEWCLGSIYGQLGESITLFDEAMTPSQVTDLQQVPFQRVWKNSHLNTVQQGFMKAIYVQYSSRIAVAELTQKTEDTIKRKCFCGSPCDTRMIRESPSLTSLLPSFHIMDGDDIHSRTMSSVDSSLSGRGRKWQCIDLAPVKKVSLLSTSCCGKLDLDCLDVSPTSTLSPAHSLNSLCGLEGLLPFFRVTEGVKTDEQWHPTSPQEYEELLGLFADACSNLKGTEALLSQHSGFPDLTDSATDSPSQFGFGRVGEMNDSGCELVGLSSFEFSAEMCFPLLVQVLQKTLSSNSQLTQTTPYKSNQRNSTFWTPQSSQSFFEICHHLNPLQCPCCIPTNGHNTPQHAPPIFLLLGFQEPSTSICGSSDCWSLLSSQDPVSQMRFFSLIRHYLSKQSDSHMTSSSFQSVFSKDSWKWNPTGKRKSLDTPSLGFFNSCQSCAIGALLGLQSNPSIEYNFALPVVSDLICKSFPSNEHLPAIMCEVIASFLLSTAKFIGDPPPTTEELPRSSESLQQYLISSLDFVLGLRPNNAPGYFHSLFDIGFIDASYSYPIASQFLSCSPNPRVRTRFFKLITCVVRDAWSYCSKKEKVSKKEKEIVASTHRTIFSQFTSAVTHFTQFQFNDEIAWAMLEAFFPTQNSLYPEDASTNTWNPLCECLMGGFSVFLESLCNCPDIVSRNWIFRDILSYMRQSERSRLLLISHQEWRSSVLKMMLSHHLNSNSIRDIAPQYCRCLTKDSLLPETFPASSTWAELLWQDHSQHKTTHSFCFLDIGVQFLTLPLIEALQSNKSGWQHVRSLLDLSVDLGYPSCRHDLLTALLEGILQVLPQVETSESGFLKDLRGRIGFHSESAFSVNVIHLGFMIEDFIFYDAEKVAIRNLTLDECSNCDEESFLVSLSPIDDYGSDEVEVSLLLTRVLHSLLALHHNLSSIEGQLAPLYKMRWRNGGIPRLQSRLLHHCVALSSSLQHVPDGDSNQLQYQAQHAASIITECTSQIQSLLSSLDFPKDFPLYANLVHRFLFTCVGSSNKHHQYPLLPFVISFTRELLFEHKTFFLTQPQCSCTEEELETLDTENYSLIFAKLLSLFESKSGPYFQLDERIAETVKNSERKTKKEKISNRVQEGENLIAHLDNLGSGISNEQQSREVPLVCPVDPARKALEKMVRLWISKRTDFDIIHSQSKRVVSRAWSLLIRNRFPEALPPHWKLDPTENFSRMRFKMKRHFKWVDHKSCILDEHTRPHPEGYFEKLPSFEVDQQCINESSNQSEADDAEDLEFDSVNKTRIPCQLIAPGCAREGIIWLTTLNLCFTSVLTDDENQGFQDTLPPVKKRWPLRKIREMHSRCYMLRNTGLEVFMVDHVNFFLNFETPSSARTASKMIRSTRPPKLARVINGMDDPAGSLQRTNLTARWRNGELSNFDYLMQLNVLSGRTYNDLSQYPVFPWIIADYQSQTLDLTKKDTFRDLTRPIGALEKNKERECLERYATFDDPVIPKFHHGSHYSSAALLLHYLVRVEPFTTLATELQGGRFDRPDRMFNSVAQSWKGCLFDAGCVAELIPEFFCSPEFLVLPNDLQLGFRQDGNPVGDVELPPWANGSPHLFVSLNRAALECDYVSANLHHCKSPLLFFSQFSSKFTGIDLVFGYKQQGKFAVEACNVFFYLTYRGMVDLDKLTDDAERLAITEQINHFGQTPAQLIKDKPHPARWLSLPEDSASEGSFTVEDSDDSEAQVSEEPEDHVKRDKDEKTNTLRKKFGQIKKLKTPRRGKDRDRGKRNIFEDIARLGGDALSAYSLQVSTGSTSSPIEFIGAPREGSSSLAAAVSMRGTRKLVTVDGGRFLGVHHWNPSHPSSGGALPFTFELDPLISSRKRLDDRDSTREWNQCLDQYFERISDSFEKQRASLFPCHYALTKDGKALISTGYIDFSLKCTSVESQKQLFHRSMAHLDCITCISLDGSLLVTGSRDCTVKVWRVNGNYSLKCKHVLRGHYDILTAVALNSEIDLLVSASIDGLCNLYTPRKGRYTRSISLQSAPHCIAISASIGLISFFSPTDQMIQLFDVNGRLLESLAVQETVDLLVLAKDGKHLITGGTKGDVVIRSIPELVKIHKFATNSAVCSIFISLDDKQFLLGLADGKLLIVMSNNDGPTQLRESHSKQPTELPSVPKPTDSLISDLVKKNTVNDVSKGFFVIFVTKSATKSLLKEKITKFCDSIGFVSSELDGKSTLEITSSKSSLSLILRIGYNEKDQRMLHIEKQQEQPSKSWFSSLRRRSSSSYDQEFTSFSTELCSLLLSHSLLASQMPEI